MLHMERNDPPKFNGTDLWCVPPPWQTQMRLVGPHCQCCFLKKNAVLQKVHLKGIPHRYVAIPLWATQRVIPKPIDNAVSANNERPEPSPIRWKWVSADASVPPGVSPENRFRVTQRPSWSACFLPSRLPQLFAEFDASIAGAIKFLIDVLSEEKQMFGLEGMNAGMSEAHRLMSICFDWGRLVHAAPQKADAVAFADLCKLLMPYLRHTLWPPRAQYPAVIQHWPKTQELRKQYVLMLHRIRRANADRPQISKKWWAVARYKVTALESLSSVIEILQQPVFRALPDCDAAIHRLSNGFFYKIASTVSKCLGQNYDAPEEVEVVAFEAKCFSVSPYMLARIGFPWQRYKGSARFRTRAAIAEWSVRDINPAGLAILLLPGVVGKLVYIEEVVKELDWSAVSASIDSDPFFGRDGPTLPGHEFPSAWHAARVHHQCRLMGVPEAACERVGSTMKMLWNKNQSTSVSTLMDTTLLATAGVTCAGTQLDEELCCTVAQAMARLGKSAPTLSKRRQAKRDKSGVNVSRSVMNFREDAVKALREAGRCDALGAEQHAKEDEETEESNDEWQEGEDGGRGDAWHSRRLVKFSRAAVEVVAGHEDAKRMQDLETDITGALRQGKPVMALPSGVQDELKNLVSKGSVKLPPLGESRRRRDGTAAPDCRAGTPSVVQERLDEWLTSDAGKEWQAKRDQRISEALA